jgi:hypothetical protein
MAISDPKKPWVVVFQFLGGTSPGAAPRHIVQQLFTVGEFGNQSLADFWQRQTLGNVSIAGSTLLPWRPSGWTIRNHPGRTAGVSRQQLVDRAKRLVPNMGRYRGVLAVYNYPCNGGQQGADVSWGLNGYGSTPQWADASWRRCNTCQRLFKQGLAQKPCAAPATPGGGHTLGGPNPLLPYHYMSITSSAVPGTRMVSLCGKCGTLFAQDEAAQPGVTECPAGGSHSASARVRVLAGWVDPPADRTWSICKWCRSVLPDDTKDGCPGHQDGHEHIGQAAVHFPYVQIDMKTLSPRDFVGHEMGHTYGFPHGRGIAPRTEHTKDDNSPGAYGDPFDIMSYGDCDFYQPAPGDPDFSIGSAGPGVALPHLLAGGILSRTQMLKPNPTPATPFVYAELHPPTLPGAGGRPGAIFDNYLVEFRDKHGFDRSLRSADGELGAVLVRYLIPGGSRTPNLVPSMRGEPFLGEEDYFEPRLGMGNISIRVEKIDPSSRKTLVRFSRLAQTDTARTFKRWLVIPYRASDSTASFAHGKTADLVAAVEQYWRDMAGPAYWTAGAYVLSADSDPNGNGPFVVPWTISQLKQLGLGARVKRVIFAALSLPNPENKDETLAMDWRWFTGIILLSCDSNGQGYGGSMTLDAGVSPQGTRIGQLPFDVIEVPYPTTQSILARTVGHALGLGRTDNPYSGMADDGKALVYSAPQNNSPFGKSDWGPMGPSLSSGELRDRGWLPDSAVKVVSPSSGGSSLTTLGTVTLSPLFRENVGRPGVIRAEIGRYAFELRTPSGWDRGINAPIVLAYGTDPVPLPLGNGDGVAWGGNISALTGGGLIQVTSLTNDEATLTYSITTKPVIEAGGGSIRDGGTILIGANGHIYRLPIGDPYEKQARRLIERLQQLIEKVGRQ